MELYLDELELVLPAIASWAERHPEPDAELIAFAQGDQLTPREIAMQLYDPGPLVRQFLGVVAFRVRRSSATEVAGRFYGTDPGAGAVAEQDLRPTGGV